jgi:hypothetical protein
VPAALPALPLRPAVARSFVGRWTGQAGVWPFELDVLADDGEHATVEWKFPTSTATIIAVHAADGSLTVSDSNRLENAHFCGEDICATFYQQFSDSRMPVVLKRVP